MRRDNLGPARDLHTRLLTPEDLAHLQSLFERCGDYFQIATGQNPAPDEAQRAFVSGPPTKAVNDKRTVGLFEAGGTLVGVLDAITDWPDEGVWTVGMVLLDPARRGAGAGSEFLAAFHEWAAAAGAREFRTAVVAHHERGVRFVERMGYRRERAISDYDAGARRAGVVFFTRKAAS